MRWSQVISLAQAANTSKLYIYIYVYIYIILNHSISTNSTSMHHIIMHILNKWIDLTSAQARALSLFNGLAWSNTGGAAAGQQQLHHISPARQWALGLDPKHRQKPFFSAHVIACTSSKQLHKHLTKISCHKIQGQGGHQIQTFPSRWQCEGVTTREPMQAGVGWKIEKTTNRKALPLWGKRDEQPLACKVPVSWPGRYRTWQEFAFQWLQKSG